MMVERSIEPARTGTVERAGIELAWAEYGDGPRTVLLMPPWNLQDSRVWKLMVAALWPGLRVVTFDPPGNGMSAPSSDPERYSPDAVADDALAVLAATDTDRAVLVAHSRTSQGLLALLARRPEQVAGAVFLAPFLPYTRSFFPRLVTHPALRPAFDLPLPAPRGWSRMNARFIRRHTATFAAWFVRLALSTPYSEWAVDESVRHALEGDVESVIASARSTVLRDRDTLDRLASQVEVPVLVVHGDRDRLTPLDDARWLAAATAGELLVLPGGDHCPHGRPVMRTARAIRDLAETVLPGPDAVAPVVRDRPGRGPRILAVSSPIGLGHARRDLAILGAVRELRPDVEVHWLAQHPVTAVLEAAGETIHPASAHLLSECRHFELESAGHELDVFTAFGRADDLIARNYAVFREVLAGGGYDLVVADEAWEIDHYLHEHPEDKRVPFAWLTDFVGVLPVPESSSRQRELIADANALMVARTENRPVRDLALFVGNPEDALDAPLGPGLPTVAEFARRHFTFTGYAGARRYDEQTRADARHGLGIDPDEPFCVVAVGGSGVGTALLERAVSAHELARQRVPELRTVLVTGPRITRPAADVPGLTVLGYLPDLDRVLAGADTALVQGGLATAMELAANQRPFVYVPLQRHFEQNLHVPHRLDNYGAGRRLDFAEADPDHLAASLLSSLHDQAMPRPVEEDGHRRAAASVVELLEAVL